MAHRSTVEAKVRKVVDSCIFPKENIEADTLLTTIEGGETKYFLRSTLISILLIYYLNMKNKELDVGVDFAGDKDKSGYTYYSHGCKKYLTKNEIVIDVMKGQTHRSGTKRCINCL